MTPVFHEAEGGHRFQIDRESSGSAAGGDWQDDFVEFLRRAKDAATSDDDLGGCQFRTIRRGERIAHMRQKAGIGFGRDGLDRCQRWAFIVSVDRTVWMALPA